MEDWADFFVGQLGAAGALAGLLVVSMSINIERILSTPNLSRRGAQTLVLIGGAMIISGFGLFPHQSVVAFGWETLVIGVVIALSGVVHLPRALAARKPSDPLFWTVMPVGLVAIAALPMLAGAGILIAGDDGGVYWVATAIIFCMVAGLLNGWVLLVEILR